MNSTLDEPRSSPRARRLVDRGEVPQPGMFSVSQPNNKLISLPYGAAETLSQLTGQRMMFFGAALSS